MPNLLTTLAQLNAAGELYSKLVHSNSFQRLNRRVAAHGLDRVAEDLLYHSLLELCEPAVVDFVNNRKNDRVFAKCRVKGPGGKVSKKKMKQASKMYLAKLMYRVLTDNPGPISLGGPDLPKMVKRRVEENSPLIDAVLESIDGEVSSGYQLFTSLVREVARRGVAYLNSWRKFGSAEAPIELVAMMVESWLQSAVVTLKRNSSLRPPTPPPPPPPTGSGDGIDEVPPIDTETPPTTEEPPTTEKPSKKRNDRPPSPGAEIPPEVGDFPPEVGDFPPEVGDFPPTKRRRR